MQPLRDHVFIVTGGGGAIARSILDAFAREGARLAVVDRGAAGRVAAAAVNALHFPADLTSATAATEMVEAVRARCGRIDGLIHAVGGFELGRIHEVDPSQYDRMFDVNVRTLFHAVRAVLPPLLKQNAGFVAAFSSEPAWNGRAGGKALYGAAKAAVATFMHGLDEELAGTDVSVAIVYPMGPVDTPANRRDMPDFDPARFIDPAAIAEMLLFAATARPRGRLVDLPIHPPRR